MSADDSDAPRSRSIDISVEVDATPEEAWSAISTGEGIRRWFAPEARVEAGPEGSVWLSWGGGVEGEAAIDAWEPGRRLRWIEEYPDPGSPDGTVRLAVEFTVEGRGGSTVVRLVHSGFTEDEGWDGYFDGLLTGWSYFMRHLKLYLDRHRGEPRQMIHDRRAPGRAPDEAWQRIFGPDGLDVPEALEGAPDQDRPFRIRGLAGEELTGRTWSVIPGRAFSGVIDDLDDAPLFVEFEGSEGPWKCGVWLSTYGLPEAEVAALQERLTAACAGAFG